MLPLDHARAQSKAKWTRYNVTSAGGKKALSSYAKGVEAMLKLPADHPQNWFRNAFIHILDCPHGNWWFYVWHRGYVGYFEETIRSLSGDPDFAIPYWDWTTLPQIPDSMFDGILTPQDMAFEPYIGNFAKFTNFIKPALTKYWGNLDAAQRAQLSLRGYSNFDLLWNDVTGYSPENKSGVSGNMAYAITCGSRFLTRDNPKLDEKTAYNASPFVVYAGLLAADFYNSENTLSFTSSKTPSHNTQPGGPNSFSVLEGLPHNKVHNYIGGVGPLDPGPYGYMTNFLSPVDPIFFLHHANLDRLWDVWTRKQKRLNLPWLPSGQDLQTFTEDPFLFFVDGKGQYVGKGKAGDYVDMERFQYEYEPGFGEKVVQPSSPPSNAISTIKANVENNAASVSVPNNLIERHLASATGPALIAQVTLPRPNMVSSVTREFDVLVGAPGNLNNVNARSPYYAGTIAFFGNMADMKDMPMDATFAVPLPKTREAFSASVTGSNMNINIRVVPSQGNSQEAPPLKALSVHAL